MSFVTCPAGQRLGSRHCAWIPSHCGCLAVHGPSEMDSPAGLGAGTERLDSAPHGPGQEQGLRPAFYLRSSQCRIDSTLTGLMTFCVPRHRAHCVCVGLGWASLQKVQVDFVWRAAHPE